MLLQQVFLALNAIALINAATVPAHPMITPSAVVPAKDNRIRVSDRRNPDEESLFDWQERMIAAGKLWRPDNPVRNGTSLRPRDDTSYTLTNIACGFVAGEDAEYTDAQNRFCNEVDSGIAAVYTGLEVLFQGAVDQNGNGLTTIFYILNAGAQWVSQAIVGSQCASMYQEIYEACNGATGGSATAHLTNTQLGSTTADVEGQFYDIDDTATCPATTTTTADYCTTTVF